MAEEKSRSLEKGIKFATVDWSAGISPTFPDITAKFPEKENPSRRDWLMNVQRWRSETFQCEVCRERNVRYIRDVIRSRMRRNINLRGNHIC